MSVTFGSGVPFGCVIVFLLFLTKHTTFASEDNGMIFYWLARIC